MKLSCVGYGPTKGTLNDYSYDYFRTVGSFPSVGIGGLYPFLCDSSTDLLYGLREGEA